MSIRKGVKPIPPEALTIATEEKQAKERSG